MISQASTKSFEDFCSITTKNWFFLGPGLNWILTWISIDMPSKMRDKTTYTFHNGYTVEISEWISNAICFNTLPKEYCEQT